MESLVSIIIPTFNRAHTLARAIESVRDQSYSNWECLVIDDFSTDNSIELVHDFSRLDNRVFIFKNISKGANPARNLGLKKAKGQYVIFLDSDDALEPKMIEESLKQLKFSREPDLAISHTKIYIGDKFIHVADKVNSVDLFLDFLKKKVKWPINSVLIRREFLEMNNIFFHEKLLNGQDYCFFLSILAGNPKIVYTNLPLAINYHLTHEPEGVKISAGDSLKFKLSRLKSRNLAFFIALKNLPTKKMANFFPYFLKYQIGLISDIIITRFN
ncbi:glycosyltransferase family 2 protein [Algoriphagus mannitolivorans]|uniref:glycosyltransferase family 2 protein n=1 Tax=Algoriphagus mannitolivorans TaxID=226504 RepID=UPI00040DB585|nr:glycosyltransferase family A protein [Algoriphagus mannitolivorans]